MTEMTALQKILRQGQRLHGLLMRPMTLGVRAIALDGEGRVFLVRHSYAPGFYLPGGGVERGEPALVSLQRELAEEGGLELTEPASLLGFYYNPRHSRRDHVALYLARNVRQAEARTPDWEIVELGFYPLDALPADATASTRARIDEYLHGGPHDPVW